MIGAGDMQNTSDETVFHLTPYNEKDSTIKVSEAVIGGFSMGEVYAKNDKRSADFEVYGGIKLGATEEEVKAIFREPSAVNEYATYKIFRYESSEVYRKYQFTIDEENKVSEIEWQNIVFNK